METTDSQTERPRAHPVILGGLVVAGLAALMILHFFPPQEYPFYPRCRLRVLTGLHCPGCGSLRAIHHLTHAEFRAALGENLLLVLAFPVLLAMGAVRWWRGQTVLPRLHEVKLQWIWLGLGVLALFGVLRNLPFAPFDRLAPWP